MKKKVVPAAENAAGTVVYCGPTIRNVVKSYTAFTDGIPEPLECLITDCPAIKHLIVPIAQIAQTRKEIQMSSSPKQVLYEKVKEFIKGGK